MNTNINWHHVESESPEIFGTLKSFLTKKNLNLETVDKSILNTFITEHNYPKFLNVPERFEMNDYVVTTTFKGIEVFLTLNKK